MRDWNRNGRVDAADRYIFHEIILKEDEPNDDTGCHERSVRKYSEIKKSEPRKLEDMSGWEIFFWGVFGVLVVMGLFVS